MDLLSASYIKRVAPNLLGIVCRNICFERDIDFPRFSFAGTMADNIATYKLSSHGTLSDISEDLIKAGIAPMSASLYALRDWDGLDAQSAQALFQ